MLVRLVFAAALASAVSVVLWAGASALIEPAPFMDVPPPPGEPDRVQLCVDCEDLTYEGGHPPDLWLDPLLTSWREDGGPIRRVQPKYDDSCTLPAWVRVTMIVDTTGSVVDVRVDDFSDECFVSSTVHAVRQWRYRAQAGVRPRAYAVTFEFEA